MDNTPSISIELIQKYQEQLHEEKQIMAWLKEGRGLSEDIIDKFKLGWTGYALSIPIYDKDNNWLFFKYRKDPRIESDSPKYWYDPGGSTTIYGWEHIINPKPTLIICAGEFDRLILETHGLAAVTLTSGESNFNEKFAKIFNEIPSGILVAYDNDDTGMKGSAKVLELVPKAMAITIPKIEGIKDVTEFINARGIDEFKELIEEAKPLKKSVNEAVYDERSMIVEDMTRVNLALAFTKEYALITQPYPTKRKAKDGLVIVDEYWVICSNKDIFRATRENLYERGLYQSGNCFISESRWNYDYVKKWLAGEIKSEPAQLFHEVKGLFEKYLDYRDKRLYALFPLWVIGTYVFPLFDYYPMLFTTGSTGVGKTKTGSLVAALAFNALNTANISDASFFRSVQGALATLVCDEAETLDDPNRATLINLLLAGISKQGKVIRTEQKREGEFVPTAFEVYSPKMIANIKSTANEALINRCITIFMSPTNLDKGKLAVEEESREVFEEIRSRLYMFTMEHWSGVKATIPTVKGYSKNLNGYDWQIWKPILTIAQYLQQYIADEPLVDTILSMAQEKTLEKKRRIALGQDTTLLEAIKDMFLNKMELQETRPDGAEFYATKYIREFLAHRLEIKIDTEAYNKLSPAKVGHMIGSLSVGESDQIRTANNSNPIRGIWLNIVQLNDILIRHGMQPVDEKERPENATDIYDMMSKSNLTVDFNKI